MKVEVSPYTRKMLLIELTMKNLLGLCALLVIGFLLTLIGYLSFRGLLIRHEISSSILPDYQQEFVWPASQTPDQELAGQKMSLWLSPSIDLGRLRGDQLHQILAGEIKNWVKLAESSERLTMLLTAQQLQSLEQANQQLGIEWSQSRNISQEADYDAVAKSLMQMPGAMAILPASWKSEAFRRLLPTDKPKAALPRRLSLATQSLALSVQSLQSLQQEGLLDSHELGKSQGPTQKQGQGQEEQNREYSAALEDIQALLANPQQARSVPFNWLTGQLQLPAGFQPIQLKYRDYELLKLRFLLEAPAKNGKVGGISTMLLSSVILIIVSLLWAAPLGLAVAVFLVEYAESGANSLRQKKWQRSFANMVNIAIQTLSGIPSIIFGLFGSILFVPLFGIGLLSGAATLVLMLLPTIILTAKEALLTVPRSYIEGSLGLGAQKWYTILHISLPSALPGILAGLILAIGRALGETAALIYTLGTGYQAALSRFPQLLADWPTVWQEFWMNPSLAKIAQVMQDYPLLDLHSSLRSISLHLYWMTINGISLQKGFSTAFVLIILIVLLNMGLRVLLSRFSSGNQSLS